MGIIDIRTVQTQLTSAECSRLIGDAAKKLFDALAEYNRVMGAGKIEVFEKKVIPRADILSIHIAKLNYALLKSLFRAVEEEADARRRAIGTAAARAQTPVVSTEFLTKAENIFLEERRDFYKDMRRSNYLRREAKVLRRNCGTIRKKFLKEVSSSLKAVADQRVREAQRQATEQMRRQQNEIMRRQKEQVHAQPKPSGKQQLRPGFAH